MLHIVFKYRDKYSYGKWLKQECDCESLEQCKNWYGLGIDCEYEIVSVENTSKKDVEF